MPRSTINGTAIDLDGKEMILDADQDTTITADTDDQIDIRIAGADDFAFKANTFEVQTGSNIDMNGTELILDADADTSITADTDDRVDIRIGGTDTVHIDASGIGVNINNPLYPLHVTEASGGDTAAIFIDGPTDGTSALYMGDSDDIDIGAIQYNHSSNYMAFRLNAAERVRFDTSNIKFTAPDGGTRYFFGNTGNSQSAELSVYDSSDSQKIRLAAADNTFITGGRLLVGLSSSTGNSGTFQVKRTDAGACGYFETNAGSTQNIVDIVQAANVGASQALRFHNNGYGNIVGSVGFNTSSTSFNTSSDYRLKENVVTDWDATTRLKQLKPSRFNFKADKDTTVDGFLAHEVSSIVPEAITGKKDAVDEDGNIEAQSIDQSKLVPLLVKTIQELEARIAALEGS